MAVGEVGPTLPEVDCERKEHQCWCGKRFDNAKNFDAHVERKHPPWMCGGAVWDPKKGEAGQWVPCKEVCSARSSLWSHFRRKHEGRYHHYCGINNCKHGSDEEWAVHLHRFKKHNIPLRSQQKCPKCGHPFGQERQYKNHVVTCRTNERPFVCKVCGEDFRQQDTLSRHMRQKHTKKGVPVERFWYYCKFCKKQLATPTSKKQHESLPHDTEGNFIRKKKGKKTGAANTDNPN